MNRAVLIAAALVLAPLPALSQETTPSRDRDTFSAQRDSSQSGTQGLRDVLDRLSQSQPELGERIASGIEAVRSACAADFNEFCGDVTPGEGRLLFCMRAHEDQLSRRCEFALFRVARNVGSTVDRIAQTCLNDIQAQCGTTDRIGQCIAQKSASLSPQCQTVVGALRQTAQAAQAAVGALRGMPVYSSDDRNLGQVIEATRAPDGKVQSIQVDVGRVLGIGSKVVTINADQFQQLTDGIKLRLSGEQIRSMPETKKQ